MCEMCTDRYTAACTALDELIAAQEEFRSNVPDRAVPQRVTDLANALIQEAKLPDGLDDQVITVIRALTLDLATAVERIMEMKQHV